jgi:predicted DNA-binding protein YlxM (UPF0122 family)
MKSIKNFEGFVGVKTSSVNENKMTAKQMNDLLNTEEMNAEIINDLKKNLMAEGIITEDLLRIAKSIQWTKEEVRDIIKASEENFEGVEELMKLYNSDALKLKPDAIEMARKILSGKTSILNAVKNL